MHLALECTDRFGPTCARTLVECRKAFDAARTQL